MMEYLSQLYSNAVKSQWIQIENITRGELAQIIRTIRIREATFPQVFG